MSLSSPRCSSRRDFLSQLLGLGAATFGARTLVAGPLAEGLARAAEPKGPRMRLGLVTYLWGQDWDLPALLANCEKSGMAGVELRTGHRHGVEPSLSADERAEVKRMFADSPVEFVGPGSAECFDHPDPERLKRAIEATNQFVLLSKDCGGSGVKVRPNALPKDVPREKTIEQIGKSLNVVGRFAGEHGQEIRLEVHGDCAPLPIIKQIMDYVDDRHVGVCWNSNAQDLQGDGLAANFHLVKDRFGATVHVRELNVAGYPFAELIKLLVGMDYAGWILLECHTKPADRLAALREQREIFERLLAEARTP